MGSSASKKKQAIQKIEAVTAVGNFQPASSNKDSATVQQKQVS